VSHACTIRVSHEPRKPIGQPELGAYINCTKWQHARSQCGNAEPGRDVSVGMHDNRSLMPARTRDNWASLVLSKALISRPYNVFAVDSFEPGTVKLGTQIREQAP
jgi:hypothetical protein